MIIKCGFFISDMQQDKEFSWIQLNTWRKKIDDIFNFAVKDPFNFDADKNLGSALEKMDPDLGHFFKIY